MNKHILILMGLLFLLFIPTRLSSQGVWIKGHGYVVSDVFDSVIVDATLADTSDWIKTANYGLWTTMYKAELAPTGSTDIDLTYEYSFDSSSIVLNTSGAAESLHTAFTDSGQWVYNRPLTPLTSIPIQYIRFIATSSTNTAKDSSLAFWMKLFQEGAR